MSYILTHTDGTFLGNINDGQADGPGGNNTAPGNPTYPLTNLFLFGKNYSGYGLSMNDNFVTLLENSASATPPAIKLPGQLWWDKANLSLNVWNGTSWNATSGGTPSATPPLHPHTGQLWWDTTSQTLKVWSGSAWVITGSGSGNTTVSSQTATITVLDNFSSPHIVTTITVNGTIESVLSNDPVFLTTDPQIPGFGTIGPGINVLPNLQYWGVLAQGTTVTGPTPVITDNTSKVATTAFVQEVANVIVAGGAGVSSFNTRAGNVTLLNTDVTNALGYTPINAAPAGFTYSNGSGWLSSYNSTGSGNVVLSTGANINATNLSVTNTIVGTITTANVALNANIVSVSTTSGYLTFVSNQTGSQTLESTPGITVNPSTSNINATTFTGNLAGNATTANNLYGPATLPNGTKATTQVSSDSSANIATTGFVSGAISSIVGVSSFNGRTNAVTLTSSDVTSALTYTPVNKAGDTITGNLTVNGTLTGTLSGTAFAANALNTATNTVMVNAALPPTTGQVLTATSSASATWQTPLAAPPIIAGNVTNPGIILATSPTSGLYETESSGIGIALSGNAYTTIDTVGYSLGYKPSGTFGMSSIAGSPYATSVYALAIAMTPDSRFIYVPNTGNGIGTLLYAFAVNIDGTLTPVPGSPYSVPAYTSMPVVSPDGKHLYVALNNNITNTIYGYSINNLTGALTVLSGFPISVSGVFSGIVTTSDGSSLYVVSNYYNNITQLIRNSTTGMLTAGSSIATNANTYSLSISRDNKYLASNSNTVAGVQVFATNSGGTLSLVGTYGTSLGNSMYASVAYNPKYDFLAVVNYSPTVNLSIYKVNADGSLIEIAGSPFVIISPANLVWSPDGSILYVTDTSGGTTISALSFNPVSTTLTSIGNISLATALGAVISADGQLMYATSGSSASVYAIQLTTALTYNLVESSFDPHGSLTGIFNINGQLQEQGIPVLNEAQNDARYLAIGGTAITASSTNALNTATGNVSVGGATAPTAGQVLTATSSTTAGWETIHSFSIPLTNGNSGNLIIGTPVYISASSTINQAQANVASTVNVIGFVSDTNVLTATSGNVYINGTLTATTGQWDAVNESGTGGLVSGEMYYLSANIAGKITNVAPTSTGNLVAPVGIAISSTMFKINVQSTIQI